MLNTNYPLVKEPSRGRPVKAADVASPSVPGRDPAQEVGLEKEAMEDIGLLALELLTKPTESAGQAEKISPGDRRQIFQR